MYQFLRSFITRHETAVDPVANVKAGLGAVVAISFVGWLATVTGMPLLLAPLGATAAILFGQPSSPLAQPLNVMGGYLIGTIVCEVAFFAFPGIWVAAAIAVGVTVVLMRGMRVTHPPAGALPIMGFGEPVHGAELFTVMFLSCTIIIALSVVVHRIPPRRSYPIDPGDR